MYPNLKMQIWLSGVRQNRLARDLAIDETVLSKMINGYREPSPELRARLSEYFRKSESWLFATESSVTEEAAPQPTRSDPSRASSE